MSERIITGNVGEWSELYVFFHIMGCHKLVPCDGNLKPLNGNHLPVVAIFRGKGQNGKLVYIYKKEGGIWEIQLNGIPAGTVPATEGHEQADALLKELQAAIKKHKKKSLQFPKAQKFLERLCDSRLKAKATKKRDIALSIQDIRAGQEITCGFSIKSYLGSNPTLLNPNKDGTNLLYKIEGVTVAEAKDMNSKYVSFKKGKSHVKLTEMIKDLKSKGAKPTFVKIINKTFESNLRYIDTSMHQLLGQLVLKFYFTDNNTVQDVTNCVAGEDNLNLKDKDLYYYKVKKFLEAVALGMTPSLKNWKGEEDATGGFLIVKSDGELVTYHLYNRPALDEYLLNYTKFEQPSTSTHKFGELLINSEGEIFQKLALQVRFYNP